MLSLSSMLPPLAAESASSCLVNDLKSFDSTGGSGCCLMPRARTSTASTGERTATLSSMLDPLPADKPEKRRMEAARERRFASPPHTARNATPAAARSSPSAAPRLARTMAPNSPQPQEDCTLGAISQFGALANRRAAEAFVEIVKDIKTERKGMTSRGDENHIATAKKAYENLIGSLEAALEGGHEATKILKCHEPLTESVSVHCAKHYKVALPTRPTSIIVSLTKTSGPMPTMVGSTQGPRPNAKDYEFKGKTDKEGLKFVYEHALTRAFDDDEYVAVDRRNAVPECKELAITVETHGECTYTLNVTFGHIKIVLTRRELAAQMQALKMSWETRVKEMTRDPLTREQFEERLRVLQEEKEERDRIRSKGQNFVNANVMTVGDGSPTSKALQHEKAALLNHARRQEVWKRKEDIDHMDESRKKDWSMRVEERRQRREMAEEARRQEELKLTLQRRWLSHLAFVAFTMGTAIQYKCRRDIKQLMLKQSHSACVIYGSFVRALAWRRRHMLYRNVVRLRVGLAAYARLMIPAVMNVSQPVVQTFLNQYAFNKETPSVGSALARFRARIVRIQRCVRQHNRARGAYVTVVKGPWMETQRRLYKLHALDLAKKKHAELHEGGQIPVPRQPGILKQGSCLPGAAKPVKRGTILGRVKDEGIKTNMKATVEEMQFEFEQYADTLPRDLVEQLVLDYVKRMQKSYSARVKAWEQDEERRRNERDLGNFTARSSLLAGSISRPKPQVVYIDHAEIENEVSNAIDLWRRDGFPVERLRRYCVLKPVLRLWFRICKSRQHGSILEFPEFPREDSPYSSEISSPSRMASKQQRPSRMASKQERLPFRRTSKQPRQSSAE